MIGNKDEKLLKGVDVDKRKNRNILWTISKIKTGYFELQPA